MRGGADGAFTAAKQRAASDHPGVGAVLPLGRTDLLADHPLRQGGSITQLILLAIVEFFGGVSVAIGFLTRFWAPACAIEMLVIFLRYWPNFDWTKRGYEYVLLWGWCSSPSPCADRAPILWTESSGSRSSLV